MDAKKQLGREIVARYHGQAAGSQAEASFVRRFRDNEVPEEMPEIKINPESNTILLCKVISEAGLVKSNSEGRRAIVQGGVKVNGEKIADENAEISCCGEFVIQVGKRRFAKVIFVR